MREEFDLCEMCHARKANVFIKKNINGKVTEKHLCNDCASVLNKNSLIDDFFNNNIMFGLYGVESSANRNMIRACKCGTTENNVLENYHFGCSECYKTFADIVEQFVKKMGGNTYGANKSSTVSKTINEEAKAKVDLTQIQQLKKQLAKAIEEEDFLLANELKSKLNKFKSNN